MNFDREGTSLIFYISHAWRSLTSMFINSVRRKYYSLPFVSSSSAFVHLFFSLLSVMAKQGSILLSRIMDSRAESKGTK